MLLVCDHAGRGTKTGFTVEDFEANTKFCPFCRRPLDWSKASLPPEVLARLGLPRSFDTGSFLGGIVAGVGTFVVGVAFVLTPQGRAFLDGLRSTLGISARHAGGGFLDRIRAAFQPQPPEEKPFAVFRRMGKVSGHEIVSGVTGQPIPHAHPGEFTFR